MASIKVVPSSSGAPARSEPSNEHQIGGVQEPIEATSEISLVIDSIQQRVDADRCVYIMKKVEENRQKLGDVTSSLQKLSIERKNLTIGDADKTVDMLTKRQKDAIYMQNGINTSNGDNDSSSSHEDGNGSSAILLGSSIAVKNAVRPIKLPEIKKLPPYTTWIFLDRNQRMTEDQSVLGRRRIYYDQNGGEALIASDSEEEVMDEEEEKKVFIESEDNILRMTIEELGLSDVVLDVLAQRLSRKPNELKARYEVIVKGSTSRDIGINPNLLLDKDLDTALDSFDNLFCRRCLVFDCKLHGCSQDLIFPAEKPLPWNCPNEENVPCGPHCYRLLLMSENNDLTSPMGVNEGIVAPIIESNGAMISKKKSAGPSLRRRLKSCQSEAASSNAKNVHESSDSETRATDDISEMTHSQSPRKSKRIDKCGTRQRNSKRIAEHVLLAAKKRQKKGAASDSDSLASGSLGSRDVNLRSSSRKENEDATSSSHKVKSSNARRSRKKSPVPSGDNSIDGEAPNFSSKEIIIGQPVSSCDETSKKEEFVGENICKQEVRDFNCWKALEKSLFEKGVEIFGRNSCLIARNLMNGMKTCAEVFYAMNAESKLSSLRGDGTNTLIDGVSKVDGNEVMGSELRRRSRFLRRRGKVRRLKYTWKSTGYNSMRKRISDKKDMPCRQYNPCGCKSACGKDCSCSVSGTCCEKYCGCPKTCKNRFRGCHCAKSQCRSRQCPCFAAGRECDPDVCRNCWISCGDGTLGIPFQRGDNYECRNMKLLLKQQQRVLLGRSDISGWGAFLKKSVAKHEYLGEYTGELISHREADKRGKIYDRENSSFLFNLNDQYVLDAYRKGDKLKFANHSPDPNCYAKVIMVAGDHRVGIFAKERICAGEELFYDYRYEPDRAPVWARKPEASGSKKEDSAAPSTGRAKKLA